MRVLITNLTMASCTGTETYVRDLALGLRRRGHEPAVYTFDAGPLAEELQAAGIPVHIRLDRLPFVPDLIHGHHNLPAAAALLHFPDVPALLFCHDALSWHDRALALPRIRLHVAVDVACRDRLVREDGIPADRVRVIPNFVDAARFRPRDPLPPRPARALVFSHEASNDTHLPAVRAACARADLPLDVIGARAGTATPHPEVVLGRYDVVFAKARAALEAMAVGAAVVLCDKAGAGPMVTAAEFDSLRPLNFGRRALVLPLTAEAVLGQLRRYDPADAAQVSRRVRAEAGLDQAVEQLEALYREAMQGFEATRATVDRAAEGIAVAGFLEQLGRWQAQGEWRKATERELSLARQELADLRKTGTWILRERLLALPGAAKLRAFAMRLQARTRRHP
jgi:hypothetical protein